MKCEYRPKALRKIWTFYRNVAKKYKHVYDYGDMQNNIRKVILNGYNIEHSLPRRRPVVERWQKEGWHMAKADKWFYAYTIANDTIFIEDACHEQNMHA